MRLRAFVILGLAIMIGLMAFPGQAQAVAFTVTEAEDSLNTAIISDGQALSDRITYSMSALPIPTPYTILEGWLVSDDGSLKLSTGGMVVSPEGSVDHTYTSPDGENLIHKYNKVIITREPVPDPDPDNPSNEVLYIHEIPLGAMTHIRHLLTTWPSDTDKGILTNLKEQLAVAITHTDLALSSDTLDDLLLHVHHVINIIEGEDGPNFDISFGNPGDLIGVLRHAQDRKHAGFAAGEAPDDKVIAEHAALVEEYGKHAEDWATDARDGALAVLDVTSLSIAKTLLSTVAGPLDAALNGIDGTGAGGASQAYIEAQLMATYALFAAPVLACVLNLSLGYEDGTLTMDFEIGTDVPATWDLWLVIPGSGVFPVWSLALPVVDPLAFPTLSFPFPSMGTIGFLTLLSTSEGITCSDWDTVDTGASSSEMLSPVKLRKLLQNSGRILPGK